MTLLLLEGGGPFSTRSGFGLFVDPGTVGEVNLADGAVYRTISIDAPDPELKSVWVSSIDTDGSRAGGEHGYENRDITIKLRVYGANGPDLLNKLSALERKVGKLNREKGVLRLVYPPGNYIEFDVEAARSVPTLGQAFLTAYRTEVDLKFTCRPFYREAEEGILFDDFSTDTVATGRWGFDAGQGTAVVSAGKLTFTDTSVKQLYRTDRRFYDCQVTAKYHTHTSGTPVAGPIAKRLDSNNWLLAQMAGGFGSIGIVKCDAGTETALATASFTPAANTDYWIRLRIEGNRVTAEVWNLAGILLAFANDPTATPLATTTYTLAGANATKYGQGVQGGIGVRATPAGTTAYFDDVQAVPNLYVETSKQLLITPPIYGVRGDVDALAKITYQDRQGVAHDTVFFGGQSRLYDPADGRAELFWAAASLTPLGASTVGLTLTNSDLNPTRQAIMSSKITGYNVELTHRGTYRVFAKILRPTSNTGRVSIALEWAADDLSRFEVNDAWVYAPDDREGTLGDVADLGVVAIPDHAVRWQFRLLAWSTVAGDEVSVANIILVPTELGYGKVSASRQVPAPDVFSARDEFDQVVTGGSDPLNGLTAPVGGAWASTGDADDYVVEDTGHTCQRSAVSDSLTVGRYAISGVAAMTNMVAQVDIKPNLVLRAGPNQRLGVLARYVDANNWLMAVLESGAIGVSLFEPATFRVYKRVAGTITRLAIVDTSAWANWAGYAFSLRLLVDVFGNYSVWVFPVGFQPSAALLTGQDSALATGGPLATGKPGFYDEFPFPAGTGDIRTYDNFLAYVPASDAAVFASKALELRSDGASRYTADGAASAPIPVRGSFPRIAAAGLEGRASRVLVMPLRYDIETMPNFDVDDMAVTVLVTPRGRIVPQAA